MDGQTRHRRSRWQRCAVRVVVGEQDRQIKPAGPVLLCERALWPGEANALPPVGRELIGGMDGMGGAWYYYYHAHGVWRRE